MSSIRLRFSDGIMIRNKKELQECYKDYTSDIMMFITDGRLVEFLDGKDDDWKMVVEEGHKKKEGPLQIYKKLADIMNISVDARDDSIFIVEPACGLKNIIESGTDNLAFPNGNWEQTGTIKITRGKDINGMGDDSVLRLNNIIIAVPKKTDFTIRNIFLRSLGDESLISIKSGKVHFRDVHFERVRVEALGDSYVKIEGCSFELLKQGALIEDENGKIEYDENTKFEKCAKPYYLPSKHNEDVISEKDTNRYLKMSNQGDREAQYKLGKYYHEKGNYDKAIDFYQKAAEQGHAGAQNNLGGYYYYGSVVKQNYTKAVAYFQKAAEQGYVYAYYSLGKSYYDGHGVNKSCSKAVEYYRKAADQSDRTAQYELFKCYRRGDIREDNEEAMRLLRKSAEQGCADAQYELGVFYSKGNKELNISKDKKEAYKWYGKAAEQGHKEAKQRMNKM